MSTIDTTLIDGYEQMAPEQKIAALEEYVVPDPDYSGYVKKDVFDRVASELAEKKRQLRERLSEDEVVKQQEKEAREQLQAAYDALLRESTVSKYKAELLGVGCDENTSAAIAGALVDGDMDNVFANLKKHCNALDKKIRAEVLKDTPKPAPDGASNAITLDEFRKLPAADRYDFYVKNPEEYNRLYKGGNV